jgi:hypothetical protein
LIVLLLPVACGDSGLMPGGGSGGAGSGGAAATAGAGGTLSDGSGGGVAGAPLAGASGSAAGAAGTGAVSCRLSGAAGTSGAATPAGGIQAGMLYICPDPPPSSGDPCPNDFVSCTYPSKKSCGCYNKTWICGDCPATQPAATDSCGSTPTRASMSCDYGRVTCSCENRVADDLWHCGICPSVEPLPGDLCGNAPAGTCRYGADTCTCGSDGKWSCVTATCPPNPTFDGTGRSACPAPKSSFTCHYADVDQDCICLPGIFSPMSYCSCPSCAPVEGSACIGRMGDCVYGDISCSCGGTWRCKSTTPPDPCPTGQPSAGSACSVRISTCAYGSTICACDGATWSCS